MNQEQTSASCDAPPRMAVMRPNAKSLPASINSRDLRPHDILVISALAAGGLAAIAWAVFLFWLVVKLAGGHLSMDAMAFALGAVIVILGLLVLLSHRRMRRIEARLHKVSKTLHEVSQTVSGLQQSESRRFFAALNSDAIREVNREVNGQDLDDLSLVPSNDIASSPQTTSLAD
jgi:hypothetical protein